MFLQVPLPHGCLSHSSISETRTGNKARNGVWTPDVSAHSVR